MIKKLRKLFQWRIVRFKSDSDFYPFSRSVLSDNKAHSVSLDAVCSLHTFCMFFLHVENVIRAMAYTGRAVFRPHWPRSRGLQHKQSCSREFSLNGFEERSDAQGQKRDLDYLSICKKPPLHVPAKKINKYMICLHFTLRI